MGSASVCFGRSEAESDIPSGVRINSPSRPFSICEREDAEMKNRILLVDEEPRLLAALSRRLCKYFDVTTAASNDDAFDLLQNAGPFVVAIRTEHDRYTEPFLKKLEEQAPETGRMVFGDQHDSFDELSRVHQMLPRSSHELVQAIQNCIYSCQQSAPIQMAA